DTDNEGNLVGDPTEVAMVRYALDKGFDLEAELNKSPRVGEVPFESDRKLMSTIHQLDDGRYLVTVKGAPDQLIERTTQIFDKGDVRELNEEDQTHILDSNKELAKQALRVLGGAYNIIEAVPSEINTDTNEKSLTLHDLVA